MLARIHSAATLGLESRVLDVEVDASHGLPRFTIVGLPDATVREARERVRSALRNGGFPPLLLDPVDFVALYQQRAAQMQPGAAAPATS